MIMQECSDGLCKQTCLGDDVRPGPGELGGTNYCYAETLMLRKQAVEISSPLSAQARLMATMIHRFK